MKLSKKDLSELIYEAVTEWDYNPWTKNFCNILAKSIMKLDEKEEKKCSKN